MNANPTLVSDSRAAALSRGGPTRPTIHMFHFTIRDVLWLMVVAMGVAWWIDSRKAFEERARISRNAEELADELEHGRYGMKPLPEWIKERRPLN